MQFIIGARLQGFTTPGSMGVVKDMTFINCYWPKLDRPTRIFAEGSKGLKVMGNTPRNVWFPDDVEFLAYYPDALYPAEQEVFKAFPFGRRALINLSPAEAQVWWDAYNAAVSKLPPTASAFQTPRNTNYLVERVESKRKTVVLKEDSISRLANGDEQIIRAGATLEKIDYEPFVAELTPEETLALVDGKVDEAAMRASKTFVHSDGRVLERR